MVRIHMDFYPYTNYVAIITGIEKGFFQEQGITVQIIEGRGGVLPAKMVGAGKAEFGLTSASTVLMAREKNIPIKAIMGIYQKNPVCVWFRKDRKINRPEDINSISCDPNSVKWGNMMAFIRKIGRENKVKFVVAGGNFMSESSFMLQGHTDAAMGYYFVQRAEGKLLKDNSDIGSFRLDEFGIKSIDKVLITSDEIVNKRPDLALRFVAACVKSWNYSIKNPHEAVGLFVKRYPGLDEKLEYDSFVVSVHYMKGGEYENRGFGFMSQADWEATKKLFEQYGELKKNNLMKVDQEYTNRFIP